MADPARRHPENAPGAWFVDQSCIDCGMCRVVDPDTYDDGSDQAIVARQPGPDGALRAGMALLSCPVGAIGTTARADLRAASAALPVEVLPDVFLCGYADESTYGATAWLLRRREGNVLVDVPRPAAPLLAAIEGLGGVRTVFLTHRDDVGAHAAVAARFGATRILHRDDHGPRTAGVERLLDGRDPVPLAPDLLAIPVPGHTRGSMCLSWRGEVLFSGDHLWARGGGWSAEGAASLGAGRSVCWYSWAEQTASMERLLAHPFGHVLPGHGRPWHGGAAAKDEALRGLIAWMRRA